jgi:hypothetical protein
MTLQHHVLLNNCKEFEVILGDIKFRLILWKIVVRNRIQVLSEEIKERVDNSFGGPMEEML